MLTADEIQGKYSRLINIQENSDVKFMLEVIKDLIDSLTMQYVNEKGEEAVRAWGVLKGLNMATNLPMIYKASLPQSNIQKVGGIIKP